MRTAIAILLMATAFAGPVQSRVQAPMQLTAGTYGNIVGLDDIEGVELRISGSRGTYRAEVMYAEGGCGDVFRAGLKPDGKRWLFDLAADQRKEEYGPIRFWIMADGGNIRIFRSSQTDWIAHSSTGDLLRKQRKTVCLH